MSVLDKTRDLLSDLAKEDGLVGAYYGACNERNLQEWNYFVFNRKETTKSSNKRDWQTYYQLHIIHEEYIPDGYVEKVIKALESQEDVKLRVTIDPVEYSYTFKGKGDVVIEIATITFFHPEKRC
jgi:hypothetical protein